MLVDRRFCLLLPRGDSISTRASQSRILRAKQEMTMSNWQTAPTLYSPEIRSLLLDVL